VRKIVGRRFVKIGNDFVLLFCCQCVVLHSLDTLIIEESIDLQLDEIRLEFERRNAKGTVVHCKKELAIFPSPAGMSLTKLSLGGKKLNYSRPGRV